MIPPPIPKLLDKIPAKNEDTIRRAVFKKGKHDFLLILSLWGSLFFLLFNFDFNSKYKDVHIKIKAK